MTPMISQRLLSLTLMIPTVVSISTQIAKAPLGKYTDLATYYTAKDRKMGRGEAELARMSEANRRLREEAKRRGFVNDDGSLNFQHGGEVPMTDGRKPKKVTQKDRYGNSTTVEYESGYQAPRH